MRRVLRTAMLAGAFSFASAAAPIAASEPLNVVASFSIIADMAANVGGDRIALTTLVGPDGDAHVYEPRPADLAVMSSADVVLVNGLGFEGFLRRLIEASGTGAAVAELTAGAEVLPGDGEAAHGEHEHDEAGHVEDGHDEAGHDHDAEENEAGHAGHHGASDPHTWQSVHNAGIYVRNIAAAFCAADADGCDTYEANAAAYREKLEALDREIRTAVAAIPEAKRVVITSHDAFAYFAHEYGLSFLAPEGISTDSEASAADVAALIRQIRQDRAAAIFVENITNQRLVEQIANETGLKIGGSLYSDALSPPDGPAATYIDMMRHNIRTIAGAIEGS